MWLPLPPADIVWLGVDYAAPFSIEDDGDEDASDVCDWCGCQLYGEPIYLEHEVVCRECDGGGFSDVNGDEDGF